MARYLLLVLFLLPFVIQAQTISGKVTDEQGDPLFGANVYWLASNTGVMSGEDGNFEIKKESNNPVKLAASFVGFEPDTILIGSDSFVTFILKGSKTLQEVVVESERPGTIISNIDGIKTEQITQTELRKAACCDLAGCFESNLTVHPQTTNIVTNSKELRILGLSGVYNQVLINGLPMIQGLSYTYGISSVPGTLVDNIFVAKGANSVLQGFESISGQINVITKSPDNTEKLLLNAYINSFGEKQFNANYAFAGKRWSNLIAAHTTQPAGRTDRDEDTFLDLPLINRYSFSNKFQFRKSSEWGWSSTIGIKYLNEQRTGGQVNFESDRDEGSSSVYGQSVQYSQPEIRTKTTYRLDNTHAFTLKASAFSQQQASYFGITKYDANQQNAYAQLRYELNYGKAHDLKTGVSYRHLHIEEDIDFVENSLGRTYDGAYERTEHIPGAFAENTLRFFENKLTWIAGLRSDHHNKFGWNITPRTLIKANVTPMGVVRANIGTGWRTVNLFSENIGLLVSSRDILLEEELQPEKALNYGLNYTHKFETASFNGYFSTDFYRTDFQNQIFPDYDSDPTKAIIRNFTGTSTSNGFQAEVMFNIQERLELKAGYTYLDVFRMVEGEKEVLPFNAKHKVLANISYKPLSRKFLFNLNAHWFGKQRLPDTSLNDPEFQRPDYSEPYFIVNTQLNYRFKKFEIYTGCENLLDFRQERPILGWQDPFGPNFDTSFVWGPTRGREIYLGIRYKIEKS
jgi:outer membrane receptor for ferrienterochelin and colicins